MGTVTSTDAGIEAIQGMKSTLAGGLTEAIQTFVNHGNVLMEPVNYDGPEAAKFRTEWPDVRTNLNSAIESLKAIADNVEAVNQNIQAAGGNA